MPVWVIFRLPLELKNSRSPGNRVSRSDILVHLSTADKLAALRREVLRPIYRSI